MYIIDVDDFYEDNNRLDLFNQIKKQLPDFKATVFTVVGRCSAQFICSVKKHYPWLDMVPHGFLHETVRECEHWNYHEALQRLKFVDKFGLTKGFKAPGWQISDETYQALITMGYWVADQVYNNERRPKALQYYLLDAPNKLHYHVQNVCNNGLEESLEKILALDNSQGFAFVKDVLR